MSALTPLGPLSARALAARASRAGQPNDLASGVTAGFAVISYKGKVWRTKYRGEEKPLLRADGDARALRPSGALRRLHRAGRLTRARQRHRHGHWLRLLRSKKPHHQ